ncbi:glycoside hydrolase family 101 beta sandwich domain-containing protein [Verrucomicrobiaceae bacterium 227]
MDLKKFENCRPLPGAGDQYLSTRLTALNPNLDQPSQLPPNIASIMKSSLVQSIPSVVTSAVFSIFALPSLPAMAQSSPYEELATKTGVTENKAPGWIKHGAYVYRICTPDDVETLVSTEAGLALTSHLLDGSIQQIPIINGLIGDDHPGDFNWDGLWPYWNQVSFRAKNWDYLHDFMERVDKESNTRISFHVNLTDVNVGLKAFPETRGFFRKLVETKSIYRRDWNKGTNKRDVEPPYVPQDFPATADPNGGMENPVDIFALVNYQKFWESGLAKEMIDEFYDHLPYPPPVLYLDVLTLEGGNFNTGFPDGPLGGSKETQLEGVLAIAGYLRSKGTEVGTEGDRPFLNDFGTYGWLHCNPGFSNHDYRKILGAAKGDRVVTQHVFGNTGCFVVSPVASTPGQIDKVRAHYTKLLAGESGSRKMPGLATWHISDRGSANDEFNMLQGGGSDPFRGDWIDLVNGFYLTGIQELYHIGKGNVRTAVYDTIGHLHYQKFVMTDPDGRETTIPVLDCLPPSYPEWKIKAVRESGVAMLEGTLSFRFQAPEDGKYRLRFKGRPGGRETGDLNVYVNQQRQLSLKAIPFKNQGDAPREIEVGEFTLKAGDNTIAFDSGAIYAKWSDGTEAIWETPSLGKGFKVTKDDMIFADDYDRMWPDTWSGQKKIYFYSWDGTQRTWKVPPDWATVTQATLYPLTPDGRGQGVRLPVNDRSVLPTLLPQVPYILVPEVR